MGMGIDTLKDFKQAELPNLDTERAIEDYEENVNTPFTPVIEKESETEILDRNDTKVIDFTIKSMKELYYHLEKRAQQHGKLGNFYNAVGDIDKFIQINYPCPFANPNNEQEKKEDPFYNYPKQRTKGLITVTEEIINAGTKKDHTWWWFIERTRTRRFGTSDKIEWKFKHLADLKDIGL